MTCNCAELRITTDDEKVRQLLPPTFEGGCHDCAEVRCRNSFIPLAEGVALHKTQQEGAIDGPRAGARFTYHFSREMERLCNGR